MNVFPLTLFVFEFSPSFLCFICAINHCLFIWFILILLLIITFFLPFLSDTHKPSSLLSSVFFLLSFLLCPQYGLWSWSSPLFRGVEQSACCCAECCMRGWTNACSLTWGCDGLHGSGALMHGQSFLTTVHTVSHLFFWLIFVKMFFI